MTDINQVDAAEIARLKEIAGKATPGPWYTTGAPWFRSDDGVLAGSPDGNIAFLIADCEDGMNPRDEYTGPFKLSTPEADAAHIASFDPPTVLSLLAALEQSQAALAQAQQWKQRESETQEALQKVGEKFGVRGGEPRTDGVLRVLTDLRNERDALRARLEAAERQNEDLKVSVIAFLAPLAGRYAKDHGLDGLHPVHYDLLKECGARMDDFRRAAIAENEEGK